MNHTPVIKFLNRAEWKVFSEALNINPSYESIDLGSANDLYSYLNASGGVGLIVTFLYDKNDLIQLATFIKMMKRNRAQLAIKVFVINFSADKQIEKAVFKLGIQDIFDPSIQTKPLRFKIDLMMKSVAAQAKNNAYLIAANEIKSLDQNKKQELKGSDQSLTWEESLTCEADIWLLKNEQDCKRVLTRWLVKLTGPGPYIAHWVEAGTPGLWKFEFKGKNEFKCERGQWFYKGEQQPDFIWSENTWTFAGRSFELYYEENRQRFTRVRLKDKVLTIARNSDYAKSKETRIIESFDKELVFKNDNQIASDNAFIDHELEKYKNLEGTGKTDNLSGLLNGKGPTTQSEAKPMGSEVKPEFNLSSSFWRGKNDSDQSEGKINEAAGVEAQNAEELDLETKNKIQKYYKNHNETEKFEAKELSHAADKKRESDPLSGKTFTDQIEGHLSSPNLKKEAAIHDKETKSSKDEIASRKTNTSTEESLDSRAQASEIKNENQGVRREQDSAGVGTEPSGTKTESPVNMHESSDSGKEFTNAQTRSINPASDLIGAKAETKYAKQDPPDSQRESTRSTQATTPSSIESEGRTREKRVRTTAEKRDEKEQSPLNRRENHPVLKNTPADNLLPFARFQNEDELLSETASIDRAAQTAKVTSLIEQNSLRVSCQLDDFFEQTIIFTVKNSGLEIGKGVKLNLNFNYMNKDTSLKFEGHIIQVDQDSEGTEYVSVEIARENVLAFDSFMKLYETRQSNISFFLKTVKGL